MNNLSTKEIRMKKFKSLLNDVFVIAALSALVGAAIGLVVGAARIGYFAVTFLFGGI